MNPLYNTQQTQREHHFSQVKLVQDTAKALHDFLDGYDKIEPAYQDTMKKEILSIFANYCIRHINPEINR